MDYSEEKFQTFTDTHKVRVLHKVLSRLDGFAEGLTPNQQKKIPVLLQLVGDDDFKNFKFTDFGARDVDRLMALVESRLEKTVRDDQFMEISDGKRIQQELRPLNVMAHDLRSAFNVGSILRTAECFSLNSVFLTGYTPSPDNIKVSNTSMGTSEHVVWRKCEVDEAFSQSESLVKIALDTGPSATSIYDFEFPENCLLLLGNERFGLSEELKQKSDEIVEIPMRGWKNSLNVASAFAIAAFEYNRQFEMKNDR